MPDNLHTLFAKRRSSGRSGRTVLLLVALVASAGRGEQPEKYDPVQRQVEGWTVCMDPRLLEAEHKELGERAMEALANHLQRVTYIVPDEQVARLRTVCIWIELDNPRLKSMQYHPSRGWLVEHDYDPRLARCVHIPNARDLLDRGTWAKHPYVVLHELAHAYHDQVLGFDDPQVLEAFQSARQAGIYQEVLLFNGKQVPHYALTDHKEYFAESTEAYLGVNDFYPFVRAELERHDPQMYATLREIWGEIP
jgi:hypothetical protein